MRRKLLLSLPLSLALVLGASPSGLASSPAADGLRAPSAITGSALPDAPRPAQAGAGDTVQAPGQTAERKAGKKTTQKAKKRAACQAKKSAKKRAACKARWKAKQKAKKRAAWKAKQRAKKGKPTRPAPTRTLAPEVGVQFHGMWSTYSDADRARVLDQMVAMGSRWVRIDISWAMIQPERGPIQVNSWGVQNVNKVITMASSRGLRVLGTLWLTPEWARPAGGGERSAPANPADYGQAFAWASQHWSGKVGAWEVWNEPNAADFMTNPDPAAYTRMLCSAYNATQALPGPAPAQVVYGGTMHNDIDWITKTYAAGAKGCFDIMATHPYQAPSNTAAMSGRGTEPWEFESLRAVREVMRRNNDYRAVWITEFGWSSHANTGSEPAWALGVTQQQQADFTVGALNALRTQFPFVRKAFIYNDRATVGEGTHLAGYGILNADNSPKPIWYALRSYLR